MKTSYRTQSLHSACKSAKVRSNNLQEHYMHICLWSKERHYFQSSSSRCMFIGSTRSLSSDSICKHSSCLSSTDLLMCTKILLGTKLVKGIVLLLLEEVTFSFIIIYCLYYLCFNLNLLVSFE